MMKTRQKWMCMVLIGLFVLGLASSEFAPMRAPVAAAPPWAAPQAATGTLTVTSLADSTANDGYCTLREAIINANNNAATWPDCPAGSGLDVIDLTSLSGQITLLANLPELTDPAGLSVQGPGAATLAISGNDAYRMFRVFQDNPPIDGPLTVRDLTLRNAKGDNPGSVIRTPSGSAVEVWNSVIISNTHSAIYIAGGSLKVSHTTFSGNTTTGAGGAIQAVNNFQAAQPAPTVWVDASTFIRNQAGAGHAIDQNSGSLMLDNSLFQKNGVTTSDGYGTVNYSGNMDIVVTNCQFQGNQTRQGGALHDAGGMGVVYIENSRFISNTTGYTAGVIRSGGGRALDIRRSLFVENMTTEKGGVIYSYAPITVTASAFYSNTAGYMGGVIMTENDATGPITILNSLFQSNHAEWGGAIWFGRGLYVTNTTFYTNTAGYAGGALASFEGWGEINNSTFDHNGAANGAALYFSNGWAPPITLRNTIIANPLWGNNCHTYTGSYTDGGNNLQYPGTSCNAAIPELNPLLDPAGPQDNGGPTWTIALQAGSPAIDRIPTGGVCPATDQRGAPRPVDGDGVGAADCDSGAYEYGSVGPVTLSKTAVDANGTPLKPGDTISYTVRVENTFPAAVTGVIVTDTIPAYTTYIPGSAVPPATRVENVLVWSGLSLTAKQVQTLTLAVTVNENAGGQVINNVACTVQPGVSQTCTQPVTPAGPDGGTVTPVLALGKTALDVNGAPLLPGDTIRYTIQVTNSHAVTVTGFTLQDAIPAYTTYVANSDTPEADADADPLVWSNQTIPPGVKTYTFEVTINANAGGQSIANMACLTQQGLTQACTQPVTPPGAPGSTVVPVLALGKAALDVNGTPLLPGDTIRYTIQVTNPHSVDVSGVVISDVIPAYTTYAPNSDTPEADADADPLVWNNQTIPPGVKTYTFEITVNVGAVGQTIRNRAVMRQPGLTEPGMTPWVEPSGGGLVKQLVYLPLAIKDLSMQP